MMLAGATGCGKIVRGDEPYRWQHRTCQAHDQLSQKGIPGDCLLQGHTVVHRSEAMDE